MTEQQERWLRHLVGAIRPVLIDKVDLDHRQTDAQFRRRRIVVAVTLVRRRHPARAVVRHQTGRPGRSTR